MLLQAARACKEALSDEDIAPVEISLGASRIDLSINRSEFDAATQHLTARTLQAVRKALRDARLQTAEIQGVVLVGGSTRMPQVRAAVADFFGQAPLTNLNPDEVVALGAAIQANQ